METRSKSNSNKFTDAEFELLHKRNQECQQKLLAETQALREERLQFERERTELQRALKEQQAALNARAEEMRKWNNEPEVRDEAPDISSCEIDDQRRDARQRAATPPQDTPRVRTHSYYDDSRYNTDDRDYRDDYTMPRISFREALESIPTFNGYNMPIAQFARACRRARDLFPAQAERNLVRLICNKLRDRASAAVEDEPCQTITQMIDLLNGAFGSLRTADQYRGDLSTIYLKPGEHIIDYISRTKDIRSAVIESMRRIGTDTPSRLNELDELTAKSFCDGLPLPYRLQMQHERYTQPFEAFSAAKKIARRQELDDQRFERPRQTHPPPYRDKNYSHDFSSPRDYTNSRATDRRREYKQENISRRSDPPSRYANRAYDPPSPRRPEREERNMPRPSHSPPRETAYRNAKWCKYCKASGHELSECRKRQYNESLKNNNNAPRQYYNNARPSGNANSPSGIQGEPRAETSRPQQPIRAITTAPEVENPGPSESQL